MKSPKVSVILPVYNGEKFDRGTFQSIPDQAFKDFELIVDDGPTDDSLKILSQVKASRIRLLCNEKNEGLIFTLNKAISESPNIDVDRAANGLIILLDDFKRIVFSKYQELRAKFKSDFDRSIVKLNLTSRFFESKTFAAIFPKTFRYRIYGSTIAALTFKQ